MLKKLSTIDAKRIDKRAEKEYFHSLKTSGKKRNEQFDNWFSSLLKIFFLWQEVFIHQNIMLQSKPKGQINSNPRNTFALDEKSIKFQFDFEGSSFDWSWAVENSLSPFLRAFESQYAQHYETVNYWSRIIYFVYFNQFIFACIPVMDKDFIQRREKTWKSLSKSALLLFYLVASTMIKTVSKLLGILLISIIKDSSTVLLALFQTE